MKPRREGASRAGAARAGRARDVGPRGYLRIMSKQEGTGARQQAVLEGVLERITYANEESGYTVARVDTGRGAGTC